MRGILKKDSDDNWIVQYIHQLGPNATQIKKLQLHPDDVIEYSQFNNFWKDNEVTFSIVENKKMSGIVQYAKLVDAHSDDKNDSVYVVSDEEIEAAATKWVFETNGHKWSNNDDTAGDNYGSFIEAIRWYKQQLKQKK